jgi:phosphoglycerate dehydrogenase-like enzyme
MSERFRIVATSPIPELAHRLFGELGDVAIADLDDRDAVADADVLIVRTATVDAEVLKRTPRLRAIVRTGAGLDKVDVDAASRHGVPVLYAPDAGTQAIAEGTLALILATSKRLWELRAVVAEGRWAERYEYATRDVAGATLGIVGLGRIGSAVARLARAIGMDVIANEPQLQQAHAVDGSIRLVTVEELFRQSDVISLHCSLNDSTRGMVDRPLLACAKPGAILVNASRGGLIADDAALLEALDRGWLSAVGLDVFAVEPPEPGSRLVRDPRVICTPHTIGLTRGWNERVFTELADDLARLLAGERPLNVANPEALRAVLGRNPA